MWYDELGRYFYGLFFALVVTPLVGFVRKFLKDKKALEEEVKDLSHKFDKISDKVDATINKQSTLDDKLDVKFDKIDQQNAEIFKCLSRIDKATAVNTAKIEQQ